MASPVDEEDLGEKLRKKASDKPIEQQRAEYNSRVRAQYEKTQSRLAELVGLNSTLPVTISSVTVLNAPNTRRGFLDRIFKPVLSADTDDTFYTLSEALEAVSKRVDTLEKLDIFKSPISLFFDRADPTDPATTATDLDVFLSVEEKSAVVASSGTWAGTNDGSVYGNLLLRNVFGGAESFNANASYGTRTRSAYSAAFDTPLLSNPDLRLELGALQSATDKSWASHEERLRGAFSKLRYLTPARHLHELAYSGMWRQATGLAEHASPSVRADAGDSFKSSLTHTWTLDRRDSPLLPTAGYLVKTTSEVAGAGPLKGDVAFAKLEAETQAALAIPLPFTRGTPRDSGVSLTTSLRAGLLYPLALPGAGTGQTPAPSRITDRFVLGGPTDVRGFRHAGLGPRDGSDALGGDVYAAGGASLLVPLPRVGKEQPLRLQAFINGGRLLALKGPRGAGGAEGKAGGEVAGALRDTLAEMVDGLPSVAAGVGIVYALPVARLELNFSLPLVLRRGEEGRKGLGLGIGLTFL